MKKIFEKIKLIFKIFSQSHKHDPKITLYELLHGICVNVNKVLNVIMPAYIVNLIFQNEKWTKVLTVTVLFGIMQCLLGCGAKSFKLLQEAHGFRVCNLLRLSMNRKFMRLDYADTEDSKVVDAYEQAKESMWEFADVGYVIFDDIIGNMITFICMSYIISEINIWVYLIVLILVCISVFVQYKKNKLIHDSELKEHVIKKWLDYMARLMQDFKVGKEIRLFNLKEFMLEKYDLHAMEYRSQIKRRENVSALLSVIQSFVYLMQLLIIYLVAVQRFILGKLQIGSFLLYISSINALAESIKNLLAAGIELSKVCFYYKDYENYMEIPEKMHLTGVHHIELKDNIFEFRGVTYRYPGSNLAAVDNVSFSFGSQDKIGIVGENGSGKSTLIKLLLRLYDPTEGTIYLNGKDIRSYVYEEYLAAFKTVFQDFSIFSYSILENIVFDKNVDNEKLKKVLDNVGLSNQIQKYNGGLNAMITKVLSEDGINLSGGELQLLAIARTFYHDADVVVFDEPTAALDPIKEAQIFKLIKEMSQDKIAVFCAHRMSSTKFCNNIIVLESGKILENGTHDELMELCGVYYNLYSKQANMYKTNKV